jgi:2'-5' RNA ligase
VDEKMSLYVVGYPESQKGDRAWIEASRADFTGLEHDPVPPHFSLMFAVRGLEPVQLVDHMRSVVAGFQPVDCVIRCAIPFKDILSEHSYVFLVPDEGFSQIVRLHDALYSGRLASQLRLDVPFVPHVTLGFTNDPVYCKQAVDAINAERREIRGVIKALDLLEVDDVGIRQVGQIVLGEQGTSR